MRPIQHCLTMMGFCLISLTLMACSEDVPKQPVQRLVPVPRSPEAPLVKRAEPTLSNALAKLTRDPITLKVISTVTSDTYTYIEVSDKSGQGWVLAPALLVNDGAEIIVAQYVEMNDVDVPELEIHLDKLLAAASVSGIDVLLTKTGEEAAVDPMLLADSVTQAQASVELPPIQRAQYSVAQIFERRHELETQRVKVRAQVIRVAARVGGANWIWLRDGTGGLGSSLLPVTLHQPCDVGQILLIEGKVSPDRAFPLSGVYDVMLEDATVLEGEGSKAKETKERSPLPSPRDLHRAERAHEANDRAAAATGTDAPALDR